MLRLFAASLALLTLAVTIRAQARPEDDGPYAAGWRDLAVAGIAGGNPSVDLRVYYPATTNGQDAPADPTGAPYPPVVFGHGFSLPATIYQSLFRHLATHGYVSALVRTEEQLFTGNLGRFRFDLRAAALGLRSLGQSSGPLTGLIAADARAAAVGHSFGGAAAIVAASGRDDLFAAVVTMAATATSPQGIDILAATAALTQPCLHLGTDGDLIVPPDANLDVLYATTGSTRRKVSIAGGRHNYFHEEWWVDRLLEPPGTISVAEQQRITRRYQHAFLAFFLAGDPTYLDVLLGPTAVGDATIADQATGLEQPLCFGSGPVALGGTVRIHPAQRPGDSAWALLGTGPATVPTPFGTLLLDPSSILALPSSAVGPNGFATSTVTIPNDPGLSGAVAHVQALLLSSGRLDLSNAWLLTVP